MEDGKLKDFIETASSVSPFRVEDDFGNGFVRLRSEEAERRQAAHDIRSSEDVVIEALRNARDAHARNIFLATNKEEGRRRIVVVDDGDGVPESMRARIFEPRVTSKLDSAHMDKWGVHGRGMALYSISVNCEQAFVADSTLGQGSSFVFISDISKLGEKADQSSFPTFEMTESGTVSVRGPRNILRTCCEFAVDSTKSCTFYLGSPAEIAATLYAFAVSSMTASQRIFCQDPSVLAPAKRLAAAADPASFAYIASQLGLTLSERTCRRILDGQIEPVKPLVSRISIESSRERSASGGVQTRKKPLPADDRGLQIAEDDLIAFSEAVSKAYRELARAYYLNEEAKPTVTVRKDRIVVSLPVQKQ